jgi:hypothetical protein
VIFLLIEFPLRQQKLCVFYFPLCLIFVDTCCTHFIFRSQFQFSHLNSFLEIIKKMEFLFLLKRLNFLLVCDWPHSVFGQNHLFVKMLLSGIPLFRVMSEDSAQFSSQKFSESLSTVRTTCLTVRTPVRPSIIRLDDVHFPFGPLLYREATVPSCIHPDVLIARPDASQ